MSSSDEPQRRMPPTPPPAPGPRPGPPPRPTGAQRDSSGRLPPPARGPLTPPDWPSHFHLLDHSSESATPPRPTSDTRPEQTTPYSRKKRVAKEKVATTPPLSYAQQQKELRRREERERITAHTVWQQKNVTPMEQLIDHFLAWTKRNGIRPADRVYFMRKGWILCDRTWEGSMSDIDTSAYEEYLSQYGPNSGDGVSFGYMQKPSAPTYHQFLAVLPSGLITISKTKVTPLRRRDHDILGKIYEKNHDEVIREIERIASYYGVRWTAP